jgi:hypothetical protein
MKASLRRAWFRTSLLLLHVSCAFAANPASPPSTGAKDEPVVESGTGGNRFGGGSTPQSTPSGPARAPGFFVDIVGKTMPLVYCRLGEPCDVAVDFTNVGAPVAADQVVPDPSWTIDGSPVSPASVTRSNAGAGWPTSQPRQWIARLTPPAGNHEIRAAMPRLAMEKAADNNNASRPVFTGRPDMAIKLRKESVDAGLRYEVKAVISNKGNVPTGPLSVLAVLSVNHHTGSAPSLDQCIADPRISSCVVEKHSADSLAPGDQKSWKIGGKVPASSSVAGRSQVACSNPGPCADGDASNNSDGAHFGN